MSLKIENTTLYDTTAKEPSCPGCCDECPYAEWARSPDGYYYIICNLWRYLNLDKYREIKTVR